VKSSPRKSSSRRPIAVSRSTTARPLYTASDWARREALPLSSLPREAYRSEARRDSARLTHSPAFRRLQGKTQLFPGAESDFFRNRLTHSLEVAQVAKSIAIRFNAQEPFLKRRPINLDLVEFAAWCHDLGHPPFGHQGEHALDELMKNESGGFEGNAQTLRIVSRLEKRQRACDDLSGIDDDENDCRLGLNLSARALAAVLKYDRPIPKEAARRKDPDVVAKGYYESEASLVRWIKKQVAPGARGPLKTIECQIMDIADDIAYSTYDLEDTFKAGFLTPLDLLASEDLYYAVATKASKSMLETITPADIRDVFLDLFRDLGAENDAEIDISNPDAPVAIATIVYDAATKLGKNAYLRSAFTSRLIRLALDGVQFVPNEDHPSLSGAKLTGKPRLRVEALKHFTFEATIQSSRVSVSQVRAKEIVTAIFKSIQDDQRLLPDDVRRLYARSAKDEKDRAICDFIAGMTDRYAVEFYGRIKSENPETIFKPL
jgi:dGTPase